MLVTDYNTSGWLTVDSVHAQNTYCEDIDYIPLDFTCTKYLVPLLKREYKDGPKFCNLNVQSVFRKQNNKNKCFDWLLSSLAKSHPKKGEIWWEKERTNQSIYFVCTFSLHFSPKYSIQRSDWVRNSNCFFSFLLKSRNPRGSLHPITTNYHNPLWKPNAAPVNPILSSFKTTPLPARAFYRTPTMHLPSLHI